MTQNDSPRVQPKVLAIFFEPTIRDGEPIHWVYGWNDPNVLAEQYVSYVQQASNGMVKVQIVERIRVTDPLNGFPLKRDGFRYTPESYATAWRLREFHEPETIDYQALIADYHLLERVRSGEIDEVWLFSFPHTGTYENVMAGPGAFRCKSPPLRGTNRACRRFFIAGFNYELGVGDMLDSLIHRTLVMVPLARIPLQFYADPFTPFLAVNRAAEDQTLFTANSESLPDWFRVRENIAWLRCVSSIEGKYSEILLIWWKTIMDPNLV